MACLQHAPLETLHKVASLINILVGSRATVLYLFVSILLRQMLQMVFSFYSLWIYKGQYVLLWVLDCSMLQILFMWVLRLWFLLLPVTSFKDVMSSWNYLAVALVPNSVSPAHKGHSSVDFYWYVLHGRAACEPTLPPLIHQRVVRPAGSETSGLRL